MINETSNSYGERLLEVIKTQGEVAKLGPDLGGVMELVSVRAQQLTGAVGAVVELAEGDEMVYRAATGVAQPFLGLRLARNESLSGQCVHEGRMLECVDSETDERVNREACRRVGLRSMLVLPLRYRETVVGVLKVLSGQVAGFNETDQKVLGLMSEMIAASMFHAAQYEASELFHRATHDALTGLANRALFYDRLRHRLAQAQRENKAFSIINLDMDGLKPINDAMGHRAGDAAIKELATRMQQVSRDADTVARLGGDEFGLILSNVDGRSGAQSHVERLNQSLTGTFAFEDKSIPLGASIGVAMYPDDGHEIEALVEKADQAMYAVKRSRKGIAR